MTPEEYVKFNDCKPLTKKERKKGKNKLRIYNTDEPMPWTEIYTRISGGMSMEHIEEIYGHGRKIALWAIEDNIHIVPEISDTVDSEIEQRRKMKEIQVANPVVAKTMLEMANEYAPDVGKEVVLLSQSLVKKAQKLINDEDCSSNDLNNIAKAVQTMTDTIELTQRHSAGIQVGAGGSVNVQGFEFVLDAPPEEEAIEAEVEEGKD